MTYNKETIIEELHKGICEVMFTKLDGTTRTMKCTLNAGHSPNMPEFIGEDTSDKERNPNTVSVWDTEADGWRSFRLDTILEFNSPRTLNG
jgi:hypothetical protein|tara:strand:+ start:257 stop:529 length:273 start_codon:yes stop_codon:yes gene_type:complete